MKDDKKISIKVLRNKDLNNFLNSRIYGKYFVLNLGGPVKHLIAKILIFLKIGKAISCDGKPLISDKSKGINLWMRGTNLNIPSNLKNLKDPSQIANNISSNLNIQIFEKQELLETLDLKKRLEKIHQLFSK